MSYPSRWQLATLFGRRLHGSLSQSDLHTSLDNNTQNNRPHSYYTGTFIILPYKVVVWKLETQLHNNILQRLSNFVQLKCEVANVDDENLLQNEHHISKVKLYRKNIGSG